jgi:hypothetical protein
MTEDLMPAPIHKSLARGAARMVLREAHRQMEERLQRLPQFASVTSEHSAERLSAAVIEMFGDRLILVRTEFARKRSDVLGVGLDTKITDGRPELVLFALSSQKGTTRISWMDYQVSQHALERFQQRRLGAVHRIESFVDEFSPSAWDGLLAIVQPVRSREMQLLPTATGALISMYSEEKQARVGVTWIALEQLRPEQLIERQQRMNEAPNLFASLFSRQRSGKFAGRQDRVSSWAREKPLSA